MESPASVLGVCSVNRVGVLSNIATRTVANVAGELLIGQMVGPGGVPKDEIRRRGAPSTHGHMRGAGLWVARQIDSRTQRVRRRAARRADERGRGDPAPGSPPGGLPQLPLRRRRRC